jgi:hypothetical protein
MMAVKAVSGVVVSAALRARASAWGVVAFLEKSSMITGVTLVGNTSDMPTPSALSCSCARSYVSKSVCCGNEDDDASFSARLDRSVEVPAIFFA